MQLRRDGLDEPGVTRDPYGEGEQRAHGTVSAVAERMGLEITRDAASNLYMILPGRDRTAAPVIVGSHLDLVPHGGNFDGAAGVVAGLVAVRALQRLGVTPPRDVVVMGIRAEESIWFQVSYIGSRSALGTLPEGALEATRIDTGRTLAEHMRECGGDPTALERGERFFEPARVHAYMELHIEQAPSLVEAGRSVGICTGIPATSVIPMHGSKAATITWVCRSGFVMMRRWRRRSSRWRLISCGMSMKRVACRWRAPSGGFIRTSRCMG